MICMSFVSIFPHTKCYGKSGHHRAKLFRFYLDVVNFAYSAPYHLEGLVKKILTHY